MCPNVVGVRRYAGEEQRLEQLGTAARSHSESGGITGEILNSATGSLNSATGSLSSVAEITEKPALQQGHEKALIS